MRLAEHVAGTVHVDAMLESMTPGEFDEWCAKDAIEPIGYSTQTLAMILYLIHTYLSGEASGDSEAFMPWTKYTNNEQQHQNSQARQMLSQIAGSMKS